MTLRIGTSASGRDGHRSRHIFRDPTRFFKAGLVFLADNLQLLGRWEIPVWAVIFIGAGAIVLVEALARVLAAVDARGWGDDLDVVFVVTSRITECTMIAAPAGFAHAKTPPAGAKLILEGTGVTNGLFISTLDFGQGPFNGTPLWLQIAARTNGTGAFAFLSPRQALSNTRSSRAYTIAMMPVSANG